VNTFLIAILAISLHLIVQLYNSISENSNTKTWVLSDILGWVKDISILYVIFQVTVYYDSILNEIIEHQNSLVEFVNNMAKGVII
jgi:hypothetical protein